MKEKQYCRTAPGREAMVARGVAAASETVLGLSNRRRLFAGSSLINFPISLATNTFNETNVIGLVVFMLKQTAPLFCCCGGVFSSIVCTHARTHTSRHDVCLSSSMRHFWRPKAICLPPLPLPVRSWTTPSLHVGTAILVCCKGEEG